MRCHVFIGPTAFGLDSSLKSTDVEFHEPAQRNDFIKLLPWLARGDHIALVDGRFGDVPAVGHKEILSTLALGHIVWGVSSIGAIRAAEMHSFGVRPFGEVARAFIDTPDLADDEVALNYVPIPPYKSVSEPMIHLRKAIECCVEECGLNPDQASRIRNELSSLWFGYRTWGKLANSLQNNNIPTEWIEHMLSSPNRFQCKNQDFARFLSEKPWRMEDA